MRNAVALHGLRRKCALLSVVMVDAGRTNNRAYAHMMQGPRAAASEQELLPKGHLFRSIESVALTSG